VKHILRKSLAAVLVLEDRGGTATFEDLVQLALERNRLGLRVLEFSARG
jgi:hypothetical protein